MSDPTHQAPTEGQVTPVPVAADLAQRHQQPKCDLSVCKHKALGRETGEDFVAEDATDRFRRVAGRRVAQQCERKLQSAVAALTPIEAGVAAIVEVSHGSTLVRPTT